MVAVAVAFSMALQGDAGPDGQDLVCELLAAFRGEVYRCLGRRGDTLFELADAVLCRPGRVRMLAELSLEPEGRRGHGAVCDAVNAGHVRIARPRRARCRCRPGMTAGSGWRPMSATGCGRRPRPARAGCSATAMRGARAARS